MKRSVVVHTVKQPLFVPMIPLVHMIPVESLQGSQVYMQVPFTTMMEPRLAHSTMVLSEPLIMSEQQIPQNPESTSPERKTKLKLSLVSSRRTSIDSPMKKITSSTKDLEA